MEKELNPQRKSSSKVIICYDGKPISCKPLNDTYKVLCIAQIWVTLQKRPVKIKELNDIFPIQLNHYYDSRKDSGEKYKQLFIQRENYMFATESGIQKQIPATFTYMDIDWSGRHDILLTPSMTFPPKYATLLLKWNKRDTEAFIKHAMTLPEFKDKLSVVKVI